MRFSFVFKVLSAATDFGWVSDLSSGEAAEVISLYITL